MEDAQAKTTAKKSTIVVRRVPALETNSHVFLHSHSSNGEKISTKTMIGDTTAIGPSQACTQY